MSLDVAAGQVAAPDLDAVPRQAPDDLLVGDGPLLLAGLHGGPSLEAHRATVGPLPEVTLDRLLETTGQVALRGRGGAGFPFATKLRVAAARRRPVVVVNAAEGEPASAKDAALAVVAPHRVLDGAALTARALGAREVHVVVPTDRPGAWVALETAAQERVEVGEPLRWRIHPADTAFVAGQARAVVELLDGRANLPVTAWVPEAVSGHRGRPTLLSNAETWAHVAALIRLGVERYAAYGTPEEPGTTLLTLSADHGRPRVLEVAFGTPWTSVLTSGQLDGPVLVGGYHGTWAAPGALRERAVSRVDLADHGLALGAGVVLPMPAGGCPVRRTAAIVDYLADESAGRCGPCRNGLPALAAEMGALARADTSVSHQRVRDLADLVSGRGACAHPDGTARLVRTLLTACEDEVAAHLGGVCRAGASTGGRR
ncbi:MAG: NADH-ubiquinone oxidoreductase-F iron-sulfur binding region domain-containing protein [Dermatophilaceae bacterium]